MTPAPPTGERSPAELVRETAGDFIAPLQKDYLRDRSWAVALLARLRRGAGKLPQDVPDLWGMTGTDRLYDRQTLPEGPAVRAETALFLAVTLYALHQQSHSQRGMHEEGVELGAAVRRLMPPGTIEEPIRRRFVRVGTAGTRDALALRLREVVSLLRREAVPLDYALLAQQLYLAQYPDGLRQVRQSWGRGFHAYQPDRTDDTAAPMATPTDEDSR
ncbi:type I-E CRISPR-associated protein Cse2/CasB [Thermoactinospora rubra]|uniref:type I-E CRISPR-associated protein Cse2/CasB n=1 Tax=Thermoactinospora rubra TaxID=1088767 RepID=UPI000A113956|nr:type I-E CRISPR-associated protein Cse2/CasB [Thermoactinospora rubra]